MKPLSFLILLIIYPISAFAVSFDCSKITTLVEEKICNSRELRTLDSALSNGYLGVLASHGPDPKIVRADQRAWIKRRNICKTEECLKKEYIRRIESICGDYPVANGVYASGAATCTKSIAEILDEGNQCFLVNDKGAEEPLDCPD